MKNIHIIATPNPSRLAILGMSNTLQLFDNLITFKTFGRSPQNIYITNDEELVLGGYHFNSKYGDKPQKTNQRDIDSRKHWEAEDYYISNPIDVL